MDFLDKLEFLMKKNNIKNLHNLSIKCNIPYTTLKGFYTRGTSRIQLSTLKNLSKFFNCTLDYLVRDDVIEPDKYFPPDQAHLEPTDNQHITEFKTNSGAEVMIVSDDPLSSDQILDIQQELPNYRKKSN